jgi:prepilin-type processing-associated H-X9-DG protein
MYVDDHNETFPGRYAVTVYPDYVYADKSWFVLVGEYAPGADILICPSSNKTPVSYGYNTRATNGYPLGTGAKLADIEHPTLVMMLVDTDRAPTAYNSGGYDWATWYSYYPPPHTNTLNMVHVDGHADSMRPEKLYNGGSHIPYYADR